MVAMAIGVSVFSLQDPIIKGLSDGYPVTQAIAFRGLFALPLFTLLVLNAGSIRTLWTKRPWALIGRGCLQMSAYTAYYLALPALPLTTAVALWFTAPLFIVVLSPLMLGERQGLQRWLAAGWRCLDSRGRGWRRFWHARNRWRHWILTRNDVPMKLGRFTYRQRVLIMLVLLAVFMTGIAIENTTNQILGLAISGIAVVLSGVVVFSRRS